MLSHLFTTNSQRRTQRRVLLALLALLAGSSLLLLNVGAAESLSASKQQAATKKLSAAAEQQQEQLSRLSHQKSSQEQSAALADKKQGDQVSGDSQDSSASASSSAAAASEATAQNSPFGADEYVHIKPEEVSENSAASAIAKEMESSVALASEPQPTQLQQPSSSSSSSSHQQRAEHKSADDELNAHLASSDLIPSAQESAPAPISRSYSGSPMMRGPQPPPPPMHHMHHMPMPSSHQHYGQPMVRNPHAARRPPRGYPPHPSGPRMPPSYITLKGKLTGINSLISQYPHPAPGYPHQGPRHLPRGAAAGYAAFRDFVRAHANKYKQPSPSLEGPQELYQEAQAAPGAYGGANKHSHMPSQAGYQSGGAKGSTGSYRQSAKTTKVTVAQAYIPHLTAPAAGAQAASGDYSSSAHNAAAAGPYGTNPMLAKLYGGHAPQGVGRPEYNKDYGMVIHYPQATVYTEPMTVDQLHKLTGAGISQVLAQLQHNLANGHRDESNTLRSNNHHHLGNGLTIHAKEYYAPDKGGRYVPTTAAIISAGPSKDSSSSYGSQAQAGAPAAQDSYAQVQMGPNLGAGYERVKQVVAASQERYNNAHQQQQQQQVSADYGQQAQQQYQAQAASAAPAATGGYAAQESGKYSNGEPLSSLTNFLGSELEALYKANAAFTKQVEPELQNQLAAYAKTLPKTPLRYTELDQHRPTLALEQITKGLRGALGGGAPQQYGGNGVSQANGNRYGGPRIRLPRRQRANRYSRPQQHQQARQPGYGHPRPSHQYGANGQRGYQQQQQLQSYQAAEQALNNQMMQLLRDFHSGDEQYNGNGQQLRTVNQGYPHKVMQKQQANNNYGQQQQQMYNQHEGLEIPQGPNDQIGEIAELIEALKGTLEAHRPDTPAEGGAYNQKQSGNTLEDVRYLASALGQTPSYAVQVPVASNQEDSTKKGAYQEQQQQFVYQQTGEQQQAAPLNLGYHQPPQPQVDSYTQQQQHQQQQSAGYGAVQAVAGYGQEQQVAAYGQQQQLAAPAQAVDYSSAVQQVHPQASPAQYGQSGSNPIAGSYPQMQVVEQQPQVQQYQQQATGYQQQQQQPASQATSYQQQQQQPATATVVNSGAGYSSSEHTQIINHLVPLGQQHQAQVQGDYTDSSAGSAHPQPVNQIAVAAPTDAQYQQAQSLSSFVDSLPTDYQELLRQPALDGGSSSSAHLAALGQEAASVSGGYSAAGSSYNTTSVAAPSATSGYETSQHHQQQQQHQQQAQPTYQVQGEAQQQQQPQSSSSHYNSASRN